MNKHARVLGRFASLSAVLCAVVAAGCAAAPEKIAPAKVAVEPYLHMNCDQLKAERVTVDTTLTQEEREQRSVRKNDAWGVALVGLPIGRMSGGNREGKIAELKGDEIAIDDAAKSEHCSQ